MEWTRLIGGARSLLCEFTEGSGDGWSEGVRSELVDAGEWLSYVSGRGGGSVVGGKVCTIVSFEKRTCFPGIPWLTSSRVSGERGLLFSRKTTVSLNTWGEECAMT